jgi:hypothetical protein
MAITNLSDGAIPLEQKESLMRRGLNSKLLCCR